MSDTIKTNEWIDAATAKPWLHRLVLVRFDDGEINVGVWNGAYWSSALSQTRIDRDRDVTHFYVFERFVESNDY